MTTATSTSTRGLNPQPWKKDDELQRTGGLIRSGDQNWPERLHWIGLSQGRAD